MTAPLNALAHLTAGGMPAARAAAEIAAHLRGGASDSAIASLTTAGGAASRVDGIGAEGALDASVGAGAVLDLPHAGTAVGASVAGGLKVGL
jgi:hypothetical protein